MATPPPKVVEVAMDIVVTATPLRKVAGVGMATEEATPLLLTEEAEVVVEAVSR